ncbi:unnamed protein product [Urochloa humidicola]
MLALHCSGHHRIDCTWISVGFGLDALLHITPSYFSRWWHTGMPGVRHAGSLRRSLGSSQVKSPFKLSGTQPGRQIQTRLSNRTQHSDRVEASGQIK